MAFGSFGANKGGSQNSGQQASDAMGAAMALLIEHYLGITKKTCSVDEVYRSLEPHLRNLVALKLRDLAAENRVACYSVEVPGPNGTERYERYGLVGKTIVLPETNNAAKDDGCQARQTELEHSAEIAETVDVTDKIPRETQESILNAATEELSAPVEISSEHVEDDNPASSGCVVSDTAASGSEPISIVDKSQLPLKSDPVSIDSPTQENAQQEVVAEANANALNSSQGLEGPEAPEDDDASEGESGEDATGAPDEEASTDTTAVAKVFASERQSTAVWIVGDTDGASGTSERTVGAGKHVGKSASRVMTGGDKPGNDDDARNIVGTLKATTLRKLYLPGVRSGVALNAKSDIGWLKLSHTELSELQALGFKALEDLVARLDASLKSGTTHNRALFGVVHRELKNRAISISLNELGPLAGILLAQAKSKDFLFDAFGNLRKLVLTNDEAECRDLTAALCMRNKTQRAEIEKLASVYSKRDGRALSVNMLPGMPPSTATRLQNAGYKGIDSILMASSLSEVAKRANLSSLEYGKVNRALSMWEAGALHLGVREEVLRIARRNRKINAWLSPNSPESYLDCRNRLIVGAARRLGYMAQEQGLPIREDSFWLFALYGIRVELQRRKSANDSPALRGSDLSRLMGAMKATNHIEDAAESLLLNTLYYGSSTHDPARVTLPDSDIWKSAATKASSEGDNVVYTEAKSSLCLMASDALELDEIQLEFPFESPTIWGESGVAEAQRAIRLERCTADDAAPSDEDAKSRDAATATSTMTPVVSRENEKSNEEPAEAWVNVENAYAHLFTEYEVKREDFEAVLNDAERSAIDDKVSWMYFRLNTEYGNLSQYPRLPLEACRADRKIDADLRKRVLNYLIDSKSVKAPFAKSLNPSLSSTENISKNIVSGEELTGELALRVGVGAASKGGITSGRGSAPASLHPVALSRPLGLRATDSEYDNFGAKTLTADGGAVCEHEEERLAEAAKKSELTSEMLIEHVLKKHAAAASIDVDRFGEYYDNLRFKLNIRSFQLNLPVNPLSAIRRTGYALVVDKDHIRYYDFKSYDFSPLIKVVQSECERNIECSASLLFDWHRNLMTSLDIRNGEELYYVLREIMGDKPIEGVSLGVAPVITLGIADRRNQIIAIIEELGEATEDQLMREYKKRYGVPGNMFFTNQFKGKVQAYYQNGVYLYHGSVLSREQQEELQRCLGDADYLPLSLVKTRMKAAFPKLAWSSVQGVILGDMEYRESEKLLIRIGIDEDKLFRRLIAKQDRFYVDTPGFGKEVFAHQRFKAALMQKRRDFEVLEFSDGMYVSVRRFEALGIHSWDFDSYVKKVRGCILKDVPFNVCSLRKTGFEHPLDRLRDDAGLDDSFFDALIATLHKKYGVKRAVCSGTSIFCKTWRAFNMVEFLRMIVVQKEAIYINDLLDLLDDEFGIKIDEKYLANIIKKDAEGMGVEGGMNRMFYDEALDLVAASPEAAAAEKKRVILGR